MRKDKPIDKYTVELQRCDSEEMVGRRAFAERKRDKAVVECQLSDLQIRSLLSYVYNGHQPSVEESLNQLEVGDHTVLLYDPNCPMVFTSLDLITCGFDREKFEALP
jgi:hypothetical protein